MSLKKTIILALILRLLIAPFFYHPDIKSQHFHFQFLSREVFNIYQYLTVNKDSLPYRDTFNYLPLTYFSLGTYHALLKPIFPRDLSTWLNDWSVNQNNYADFPFFMLVLKLPYLVCDLGMALILLKLYGRKFFNLWLFNPFSLYLIYILGNFDVIPVFLTLLAWYCLTLSRPRLAFLVLGIATALKLYPLLFLPFFLFLKPRQILKNLLFFSLPLLLTVLPFVGNPAFLTSLTGSGLTQKIIGFKVSILPLFPLVYLLIFFDFLRHRRLENSFLLMFLAFVVLVDFHAQWLLWFLPFTLVPAMSTTTRSLAFGLVLLLAILYVILTNDNFLFWGHLTPINPAFVALRNPHQILRYRFLINPLILQTDIKILLACLSLIFIFPRHAKN